jgi:hypothetical protein
MNIDRLSEFAAGVFFDTMPARDLDMRNNLNFKINMNDSATAKSSLDATLNALALLLDDPSAGAPPRAATPETTAVALDPPAAAAPPARAWPSARVETLAHLTVLEPQARKRVAAAELAAEAAAAAARVAAEEKRHRAALSTNAMRMRLANQSHTIAQQRKSNEVGVRRLQLQRAVQRASHASGKPATITEAAAPSTKRQHLGFGSMVGAASLMGGVQRRARAAAREHRARSFPRHRTTRRRSRRYPRRCCRRRSIAPTHSTQSRTAQRMRRA